MLESLSLTLNMNTLSCTSSFPPRLLSDLPVIPASSLQASNSLNFLKIYFPPLSLFPTSRFPFPPPLSHQPLGPFSFKFKDESEAILKRENEGLRK